MTEVLAAIKAKHLGTAALQQGLTGGFYLGYAPQTATMPYAVGTPIGAAPVFNTGAIYEQPVQVSITFYAATFEELAPIVERWKHELTYQPLPLLTGRAMAVELTNENSFYNADENEAFSSYVYAQDYTIHSLQSL